ncbi:MAG: PDZ domain-containing protein [Myxococcales bacterium]|nr:PDZ domain-containing protein [Myxococcales bacterium]
MSAPTWQLQRPRGLRAATAGIALLIAIGAASAGIQRVGEIRAAAPAPAAELPAETQERSLALVARPLKATTSIAELSESRIVSRALRHVRRRYVDPSRIDPPHMLEASLQAVAHAIAEVLVDAEGRDPDGRPMVLRVRVGEDTLRLDCSEIHGLFELDWALHRVISFLTARIPKQAHEAHVEYVAVNGLLDTLDPYSHMLDPDAWQEMQTHTGGKFGGLGIRVLTRDGVLTIVGVIANSPASRAGLVANDRILRINGEGTLNMRIEDAVDRLRGKVGSAVRLRIGRKQWTEPRAIKLVRAVIQLQSVEGRPLTGGIVYARIKNFQRGTAKELRQLLDRLQPVGGARGLVLDLRDNPGGLLDEAVRVCDLLMDGGPVVITVADGGRDRETRTARDAGTLTDLPVAVLVNRRSASASEIVAGALKESNRAVILGDRTWGKGTVQVPFAIGDGALKLTIAKYLVPGDVSIQDVGVTPDIELRYVEIKRGRVSLYAPRSRRVRRKPWAHKTDEDAANRRPMHRLRLLLPVQDKTSDYRDREPIRRASALLQTAGDAHAATTLAQARPWIAALHDSDSRALRERLSRSGVDWATGPQPPKPRLRLEVEPVLGGLVVAAGRTLKLPVRVHNLGTTPLYRVHVFSRSSAPALDGVEQVIGKLVPGQSRLVYLRLRPSRRHRHLQAPVAIVGALDGKPTKKMKRLVIRVNGAPRPVFSWRISLIEDPKDDGLLSPNETAKVRVEVKNVGPGKAGDVVASLRSLAGRLMRLDKGRVRLGALKPGQRAEAEFTVRAVKSRNGLRAGLLMARLEVSDRRLGTRRSERIVIPWRGPASSKSGLERVRTAASKRLDVWSRPPTIKLDEASRASAPLSANKGERCRLRLRGTANFESTRAERRYLSVSVGDAKKAYVAGHGKTSVPFDLPVMLDKGLNRITILARAGRDQVTHKRVLVHCRVSGQATTKGAKR